jgi:hypothetical protein
VVCRNPDQQRPDDRVLDELERRLDRKAGPGMGEARDLIEARRGCARWYVGHGRWDRAAATLGKARDLEPDDLEGSYLLAAARLHLGDRDGYRGCCAEVVRRFGPSRSAARAALAARLCLVVPDAAGRLHDAQRLAGLATDGTAKHRDYPEFALVKGMAEYRSGRYEAAADWLGKEQARRSRSGQALAGLFLAMARHRLGQDDEARRALDQAGRQVGELRPRSAVRAQADWPEWVLCEAVRREAEALVGAGPGSKR